MTNSNQKSLLLLKPRGFCAGVVRAIDIVRIALETFGPDANKLAFLVDGFVGGPGMVTTARRQYPNQFLHYHRAGHGAVTSPSSKRGYTAFVLAKMSRLQGASGIHVGTMGYGKMEGEGDDKIIAYMIERDECQGPVYFQKWYGVKPTTPIISGGMNALRLPGFFQNLGHGNVINTAGGGSYGHIDSPAAGAISLRQSYECWKAGADPIDDDPCGADKQDHADDISGWNFHRDTNDPQTAAIVASCHCPRYDGTQSAYMVGYITTHKTNLVTLQLGASVVSEVGECTVAWSQTGGPEAVTLRGTPGAEASFDIPGLISNTPMREVAPGVYQGTWTPQSDRYSLVLPSMSFA